MGSLNREFLTDRCDWITSRLKKKGGRVEELELFDPIPISQVEALEAETGLQLPADLRQFLTECTGGFKFSWYLDRKDSPLCQFGGNSEQPFIGASDDVSLLELYNQYMELMDQEYLFGEDPENDASIRNVFPLYSWYGEGSDKIVLRPNPVAVLYLDHEGCYKVEDGGIIVCGTHFSTFVSSWANLGFPQFDEYSKLFDKERLMLDDKGPAAKAWLEWLSMD
jgi:hypothetical protein